MGHSTFLSQRAGRRRPRLSRAGLALAAVAFAGAAGGALSGCSTAPEAASVNGQAISIQQLDHQLKWWSSIPTYVKAEDQSFADQAAQAASQGQQVPAYTVEGSGTGPGVYGMYWTSQELSNMVTAVAVHQYLHRRAKLPSALQVAAAWASEYASDPTQWLQLPPVARAGAASQDADRAAVDGTVTDASQDKSFYRLHKSYFWSKVCLNTADVSVASPDGVDMAASKREAQQVARAMTGHPARPVATPVTGSGRYCLAPGQLIDQPAGFRARVSALAPGTDTVLAENYGYRVVEVLSRTVIPYSDQVAGDIEAVSVHGGSQQPPTGDTKVTAILKAADVHINPAYGSWATTLPSPYPPQVLPPGESA
ncbi:MAG: hypothetical protein ACRDZX_04390 [Acidimicrobiales bacterium]